MSDSTPLIVGGGLVAIIGIILAIIGVLKPKPTAPVPQPVEKQAEEVADKKIEEAREKEVVDVKKAQEDHDKVLSEVLDKEEKQVDKAANGQAVNDFLKDIGSKVRS